MSVDVAERMLPKLARAAHLTVSENEEDWRGYGGRPLCIAAAPSSLLVFEFSASVEKQLDFEIESQNAEGEWLKFFGPMATGLRRFRKQRMSGQGGSLSGI